MTDVTGGFRKVQSRPAGRGTRPNVADCTTIPYRVDFQPGHSFFERVCLAGSRRTKTVGSGAGIRTVAAGLLGDGASLDSTLVHYGVQVAQKAVAKPKMQR